MSTVPPPAGKWYALHSPWVTPSLQLLMMGAMM